MIPQLTNEELKRWACEQAIRAISTDSPHQIIPLAQQMYDFVKGN